MYPDKRIEIAYKIKDIFDWGTDHEDCFLLQDWRTGLRVPPSRRCWKAPRVFRRAPGTGCAWKTFKRKLKIFVVCLTYGWRNSWHRFWQRWLAYSKEWWHRRTYWVKSISCARPYVHDGRWLQRKTTSIRCWYVYAGCKPYCKLTSYYNLRWNGRWSFQIYPAWTIPKNVARCACARWTAFCCIYNAISMCFWMAFRVMMPMMSIFSLKV